MIPRTTAMHPPPSQRRAPAWWAASAVAVCGSSAADRTSPWSRTVGGRCRARRSVERMSTEGPATLAAWLRTRSDEQLAALLAARPDVARPAPSDVVALASRLAVPVSVDRALDELDAVTLQVLDVVLLAPPHRLAADELGARPPPAACPPRGWWTPCRRCPTRCSRPRSGRSPTARCSGGTTSCALPSR